MRVKAQTGQQCPMENKPREYITDEAEGVEVAASAYYRRLVDDGSLVLIPDAAPGSVPTQSVGTRTKNSGSDVTTQSVGTSGGDQ